MKQPMHIFKEPKFHPVSMHATANTVVTSYAIAHCGVKFNQYTDEHVVEQDVEQRVRQGLSPQSSHVRTKGDLRYSSLPPDHSNQICEDCLASASMQMLILKWTDV